MPVSGGLADGRRDQVLGAAYAFSQGRSAEAQKREGYEMRRDETRRDGRSGKEVKEGISSVGEDEGGRRMEKMYLFDERRRRLSGHLKHNSFPPIALCKDSRLFLLFFLFSLFCRNTVLILNHSPSQSSRIKSKSNQAPAAGLNVGLSKDTYRLLRLGQGLSFKV